MKVTPQKLKSARSKDFPFLVIENCSSSASSLRVPSGLSRCAWKRCPGRRTSGRSQSTSQRRTSRRPRRACGSGRRDRHGAPGRAVGGEHRATNESFKRPVSSQAKPAACGEVDARAAQRGHRARIRGGQSRERDRPPALGVVAIPVENIRLGRSDVTACRSCRAACASASGDDTAITGRPEADSPRRAAHAT